MIRLIVRSTVAIAFVVLMPSWLLALTLVPIAIGTGFAIAREPTLALAAIEFLRRTLGAPDD